jgi:DNA-binding transcriptional MerR regulator
MYKIGKAAELAGTTSRTIKWYEELQLLPKSERSPGGFRLYTDQDIEAIRRIQKMQGLGLSLQVIREVQQYEQIVDGLGRKRMPTPRIKELVAGLQVQRRDVAARLDQLRQDLREGEELLQRLDQDLRILGDALSRIVAEEQNAASPAAAQRKSHRP